MSKILVIDDEPLVRGALVRLLHGARHDTVEASDRAEGLRLASEAHPDLVIADVVLPEREGVPSLAELRRQHPDVPLVVMTAGTPCRALDSARQFGAVTTLAKPFTRADVLAAVREALGQPQ